MADVLIKDCRLIQGHPMRRNPVLDKLSKQPITDPVTGTPKTSMFMGIAVAKGAETHWNQTAWGQAIHAAGVAGWPNGEHAAPTFAWKIVDGDSQIPDQKGVKPATREGYPGHWVIKLSTNWVVVCNHIDKLEAIQQIQNENEIKTGDYCQVFFDVKGNAPSESPGVYLNPKRYAQVSPGEAIQAGASAVDVFGGGQPAQTAQPGAFVPPAQTAQPGAFVPPAQTAQPGAFVPPAAQAAPDPHVGFLNPAAAGAAPPVVQSYKVTTTGAVYTKDQLVAGGWTDEHIATQATPV